MRALIYVVEMLCSSIGQRHAKWEPCEGGYLRHDSAYYEMRQWRARNPGDSFRIRVYVRRAA